MLNHGTGGHLLADVLAAKGIPVVMGPLFTSRSKVELRQRSLHQRSLRNPGVLARAGVRIAITTDHPVVPIHFLVHQATPAVKEGLDRDVALQALTTNPAAMMGLGDPLDVMSRALRVFVRGREVYTWDEAASRGDMLDPYDPSSHLD